MRKNKDVTGQINLDVALRTQCQIRADFPCTYYVASQYRYIHEGKNCENQCCYGCEEKNICGFACNASKTKK